MKNILLLVLLCTSVFASATITIIKSNGGPSGYSDIYENHNNNGDHGLSCKNPGYDACVFTIRQVSLVVFLAIFMMWFH